MKKQTKNIILYSIFTLLISSAVFCFFNKHAMQNTQQQKTYKTYTSKALIDDLKKESFESLTEKTIEVNGTLKKIHKKNNKHTLYLSDNINDTYILCELQNNQLHKLPNLKIGHLVKVKGVFKGHLVDLILLNCIIK